MTSTLTEESVLSCPRCRSISLKITVKKTTTRKIKNTIIKIRFSIMCLSCGLLKKFNEKQFLKKLIEEVKP